MSNEIKKIDVPFEFRKRIHTSDTTNAEWANIDLNKFNSLKPIIICLGGIATITDKDASYVAKFAQRLVGVNDFADIISIKHSHKQDERFARFFEKEPKRIEQDGLKEAFEIATSLFFPKVTDKNGEKLPFEKAAKNMRNINIFAHCYGYFYTTHYLENVLENYLENLCYQQDEIDTIMKQVFVLSFETGDNYKTQKFSNFNISSLGSELWSKTVLNSMNKDFSNIVMPRDDRERIMSSSLYQSQDYEQIKEFYNHNKYILTLDNNRIDLFTKQLTIDGSDHDLETIYRHKDTWETGRYTTEDGNFVSQAASMAFAMALNNTLQNNENIEFLPINIEEILKTTDDILLMTRTNFGVVEDLQF